MEGLNVQKHNDTPCGHSIAKDVKCGLPPKYHAVTRRYAAQVVITPAHAFVFTGGR